MRSLIKTIIMTLVFATCVTVAASSITNGICVDVIDGDTIVVEIDGRDEVFDVADIDAPELDQVFGEQARHFLSELVLEKSIDLKIVGTGSSDRRIARIRIGTVHVSTEMMAAGMAWSVESSGEALILAGMMARGDRLGLWRDDNPIPPAAWRHRKPVLPTPTPVEVTRSLADAGLKLELRKNKDGKAVIEGLPMIEQTEGEDEEKKEEKPENLKHEFQCETDGAAECLKEKFLAKFSVAYEGDGPGTYASTPIEPGEGQLTATFQGTSALGRTYSVGAACTCDADSCQCVMQFGKLEKEEE